jgi:hypothetical protein
LEVIDDASVADNLTVGDLTTTGALACDSNIISASSDGFNVADVSILWVNTSGGNVTIGGLTGGVLGQILYICIINASNNTIIEDDEGTGNQDIKTVTGADITITNEGGCTLIFTGTTWNMVSIGQ